jgi:hypothetical protein
MTAVYMLHHNRPELLERQYDLLKIAMPKSKFIVVTTCDARKFPESYHEIKDFCQKNELSIIEVETKSNFSQFAILTFLSQKGVRSLILRIPRIRQRLGQDPSSGHARALNSILKDAIKQFDNTEICILEGDVLPLKKISALPVSLDFEGSTFEINSKKIKYFNGRILRFRVNSNSRKLINSGKFNFYSHHTFFNWYDTGSTTKWMFSDKNLDLRINGYENILNNEWDLEKITKINNKFPGFQKLALEDPRLPGSNSAYDLYDQTWIHIGNASGYLTCYKPLDFKNLIDKTANFSLSQINLRLD